MEPELLQKVIHRHTVTEDDLARFKYETVHQVCSTFALAREIEWTTRQYIQKIKKDDEEGIGTMLEIHHQNIALLGEEIIVHAHVEDYEHGELICGFEVKVGERLVATGRTGQKLLPKSVIEKKLKDTGSGED
jgi:predicted thioesterase